MKKYLYTIALVSISFLITSCGNDTKKISEDTSIPIAVRVKKVEATNSSLFVTASGKTQAVQSADLSTRMMGFVNEVYVNVGDKVKKGQLLIAINNADLQAKRAQVNAGITQAKVGYKNAEKDFTRFKNLLAENSVSQKEMDDMTANFQMAKARLEAANQQKNEVNSQFKYTNITAPFSGVITSKNIEKGAMANPGMSLLSIEKPNEFEVIAMVSESEILKIKKNSEATVIVKSINQKIKGKVTEISTSAKNTGGQFLVKVALDKTPIKILSGMFTTVQFFTSETTSKITENTKINATNKVLIPKNVIVTKGQLSGIYTLSQSNTAVLRWLRLGRSFGENIEVLSGLSADETYIINAKGKLYNGVKVTIQ
ncbi:efflux RND transporter periplasmic adaptor subunit [Tenacibaculum aestuariivivum]|uniref:efflux RND transporter periplasmic adaptor subunit n=1 Tax=Tenacibaculum aestuariivivum TaxID=2006131 RepID=UPI003AB81760